MKHELVEIRAVFLDLDNTLIDRDRAALAVLDTWLDAHKPQLHAVERERVRRRFVELDQRGHSDRVTLWRGVLEMLEEDPDGAADAWASMRREMGRHAPVFEGADALIERCHRRNLKLGLITDGSSVNQRLKLRCSGLDEAFAPEAVFISQEVGFEKPARQIFEAALTWARVDARHTVMVGDHPVKDIDGASALRMNTCWVQRQPWTRGPLEPTWVVSSLAEVASLLGEC